MSQFRPHRNDLYLVILNHTKLFWNKAPWEGRQLSVWASHPERGVRGKMAAVWMLSKVQIYAITAVKDISRYNNIQNPRRRIVSYQNNDTIMIFALPGMEHTSKMISRMLLPLMKKHLFKYQIIHFSWEFFWKEETSVYSGALWRPCSTLLGIVLTQRTLLA